METDFQKVDLVWHRYKKDLIETHPKKSGVYIIAGEEIKEGKLTPIVSSTFYTADRDANYRGWSAVHNSTVIDAWAEMPKHPLLVSKD